MRKCYGKRVGYTLLSSIVITVPQTIRVVEIEKHLIPKTCFSIPLSGFCLRISVSMSVIHCRVENTYRIIIYWKFLDYMLENFSFCIGNCVNFQYKNELFIK